MAYFVVMEKIACPEAVHRSIDELDKLILEAESILEDYSTSASAYDSGISERDIGDTARIDEINRSIDRLDSILRQYDSGTLDLDHDTYHHPDQRRSLDGPPEPLFQSPDANFQAGVRHSVADPIDYRRKTTADGGDMSQLVGRRLCDYDKNGHVIGANDVYRADSMKSLPPPPEELLYGEIRLPGGCNESSTDTPNSLHHTHETPPHHENLPPPPADQHTAKQSEKKRPPALPKRSPSTRLSTASSTGDPTSPTPQLPSPRSPRISSHERRYSQDPSPELTDQRHYQRSYSVPNTDPRLLHQMSHGHQVVNDPLSPHGASAHHPQNQQANQYTINQQTTQYTYNQQTTQYAQKAQPCAQQMHGQNAQYTQSQYGQHTQYSAAPGHHGQFGQTAHCAQPTPPAQHGQQPAYHSAPPTQTDLDQVETNGVSQSRKFFEQRQEEEVVMRLKRVNLPDAGERPPSFTPPPPPANTVRCASACPVKKSPVHQRLQTGRRMSEQTLSTERRCELRDSHAENTKPVSRSNSVGNERPNQVSESLVKPSMFKNTPGVVIKEKEREVKCSLELAQPGSKNSDVIETEGLLRPSKIKSILEGQVKKGPDSKERKKSAPVNVPVMEPQRKMSAPVSVPVPRVPVVPIRTGRTPPQQEILTSPVKKQHEPEVVSEVSTFKLKKKEKLPVGAPKKAVVGIHNEIVSNLKVGVKLKRRTNGPVIPEIHGGEAVCDVDELPPPPPDFAEDYRDYPNSSDEYYYQRDSMSDSIGNHRDHVESFGNPRDQPESHGNHVESFGQHRHHSEPLDPPAPRDNQPDYSMIPGWQAIPENCPHWKIGMLEKKNREAYEKYMRELEERALEDAKWQDVPEWKRNLMQKKEMKKKELQTPTEEENRRYLEELARLESMPEWKRQILLKKHQRHDVI